MKLKSILALTLIFLNIQIFALNIDWLKQIDVPCRSKGLLFDKDSNVYNYGNNFPTSLSQYNSTYGNALSDTAGSFFNKYSSNGQLLISKRWWGMPFFMQEIIYDGQSAFYFSGIFSGTCSVDGITITSRGNGDGMVGKMNMSGTILWITTIGGAINERADGICFDATQNNLVVTGSTTDSLYVNNVFVASAQQSTLIAVFDLSGMLLDHKLLDFLPFRDNDYDGNFGKEIEAAGAGNYFLFTDCQGMNWSIDSISGPLSGKYVVKLNSNFDTLWTRYIIGPACYYGWEGEDLRVSALGDPFITSYCSYHYGGEGSLQKLNQFTGTDIWNDAHSDGGYEDVYIDGNTIFSVGTEGAYYCPCPAQDPGYQIIKVMDAIGVDLDSLKIEGDNMVLTDITKDSYGHIFVSGLAYNSPMVVIGNDTLYSTMDTTTSIYSTVYFLMRLNQAISTSVAENESLNNMHIFPNPNTGLATLELGEEVKEGTVCIYDVSGSCLKTIEIKSVSSLQIDLSNCAAGIYFVEINTNGSRAFKKLVLN